jgi:predicted polyphosphate/ATP-dependent NAD kinase
MGAELAASCGLRTQPLEVPIASPTTAADTIAAARAARDAGADLLLFAGGDGTAADILDAVGQSLPLLGIPSGVKMRSGVFAASPEAAGDLAADYLVRLADAPVGETHPELVTTAEIIDATPRDRAAQTRQADSMDSTFFGVALVPRAGDGHLVAPKSSSALSSSSALDALAEEVASELDPDSLYLVGPGTTTARVLAALGIEASTVGVDAVIGGELVGADMSEEEILGLLDAHPRTRLILGVIGGQGMLLGRGNQQLSPQVLARVSPEDVTILASADKLVALRPALLRVDVGVEVSFSWLAGYRRVRVAPRRDMMMRVVTT